MSFSLFMALASAQWAGGSQPAWQPAWQPALVSGALAKGCNLTGFPQAILLSNSWASYVEGGPPGSPHLLSFTSFALPSHLCCIAQSILVESSQTPFFTFPILEGTQAVLALGSQGCSCIVSGQHFQEHRPDRMERRILILTTGHMLA